MIKRFFKFWFDLIQAIGEGFDDEHSWDD